MAISFMKRVYNLLYPPHAFKSTEPKSLKFGILGAANIAPSAFILPAKSHPEVIVYAVAARDRNRAVAFAKKHDIPKTFGSYQELLDDPEIDAIYNPLPNGLHFEWTMKALQAGKHVLLEKPAANTAEETSQMFDFADKKGLVLLEAFHYRFHPAIQRVKAILDSEELGRIKSISTRLATPAGFFKGDDIRYNYELGGGGMMDMGCYTLHSMRYLAGADPTSVISTNIIPVNTTKSNVDRSTTATLAFPNDVIGTLTCDLAIPPSYGFIPALPSISAKVECTQGSLELTNFVMPNLWHSLSVQKIDGKARKEKVYSFQDAKMEGKGEYWWPTYRHQLEAFVDKLRGRSPQSWIEKADSVCNMEWIEKIYAKNGLGSRPRSNFILADI